MGDPVFGASGTQAVVHDTLGQHDPDAIERTTGLIHTLLHGKLISHVPGGLRHKYLLNRDRNIADALITRCQAFRKTMSVLSSIHKAYLKQVKDTGDRWRSHTDKLVRVHRDGIAETIARLKTKWESTATRGALARLNPNSSLSDQILRHIHDPGTPDHPVAHPGIVHRIRELDTDIRGRINSVHLNDHDRADLMSLLTHRADLMHEALKYPRVHMTHVAPSVGRGEYNVTRMLRGAHLLEGRLASTDGVQWRLKDTIDEESRKYIRGLTQQLRDTIRDARIQIITDLHDDIHDQEHELASHIARIVEKEQLMARDGNATRDEQDTERQIWKNLTQSLTGVV